MKGRDTLGQDSQTPVKRKQEPVYREDLLGRIADIDNLMRAWRRVKANKGSGGIDGETVETFGEKAKTHLDEIRRKLLEGDFKPVAVRGVEIPKPSGGKRQLGIPTVADRVVQQAVAQVLTPRYEVVFSESSHGFRPNRSAHDALRRGSAYVAEGYSTVVDLDLEKFFGTVNHDRLMARLARDIGDSRVLRLVLAFLKAGQAEGADETQPRTRVPGRGPGSLHLPARVAELLWSGQREGMAVGNGIVATATAPVLSAEAMQEAVCRRQVPHEVGNPRMEGLATRHEPQGVVSQVGVTPGDGGHEQQVVRGDWIDSARITRWGKPRGAIRGTPCGVRGGGELPLLDFFPQPLAPFPPPSHARLHHHCHRRRDSRPGNRSLQSPRRREVRPDAERHRHPARRQRRGRPRLPFPEREVRPHPPHHRLSHRHARHLERRQASRRTRPRQARRRLRLLIIHAPLAARNQRPCLFLGQAQ